MLRIHQQCSAAGAKTYYQSQAEYYCGQEFVGHWGGAAARLLGLEGPVRKADFDALCDNLDPHSGAPLTARTCADRTVAWDWNFHCPKGVSLAYSLNQDERIAETLRASARETMEEAEREARTRVRKGGRDDDRITKNLVWAEFVHTTARPVRGIPDPHLHTHLVVFNQTFDPHEQQWKAVFSRELKRDAPYYEAAFHARLARRLRGLGYDVERRGKGWDLAATPATLAKKFSRRTDQIEALARQQGIQAPEKKAELGAKSREKKQSALSAEELRNEWRARLDASDTAALAELRRQAAAPKALEQDPEVETAAVRHAVQHCFETRSVVAEKNLLAEALRRGTGEVTVGGVARALAQSPVIVRELENRRLATTHEVLAEERAMLAYARAGRGACQPLNEEWRIERDWLSGEQRRAVQHILRSTDRVILLRGNAGVGKTTLLQEAAAGIAASGKRVFAFAPSSLASRTVLEAEGFKGATTVAELLVNKQLQDAARGQVLLIDEAGLLGTRTMKRVFDLAHAIDARVLLAGDWRQHGSVERGDALRLLEQEAGLRPAEVRSIRRQQGLYRDAVAALAKGDVGEGFAQLDALGWIVELDDATRNRTIAREYADVLATGDTALVVAPTNQEKDQLNRCVRAELQSRGLLGRRDHDVLRLRPLHLSEAEKADAAQYQPGDVLELHEHLPGHKKGQRIAIEEGLPEGLAQYAGRFSVYRPEQIAVARGDLLRITAGGKTKSGKRLYNGAVVRVAEVRPSGDLKLTSGQTIERGFGHVAHAYAVSSHSSQGTTIDHVLLAASTASLPAASREQFYVSMSRGRKTARVFTDDRLALLKAVQKSERGLTASELVRPSVEHRRRQVRQLAYERLSAAVKAAFQPRHEREPVYGRG